MDRRSPAFYNKSSLVIVASGIVGVIVAVWILLGFNLKGCDSFHEIGFHPASLEYTFLDSIKSNIRRVKEFELDHKATLIRAKKYKDTTGVNKKLDSLALLLQKIDNRQMLSMNGNKDTVLDNKVRFSANRDSLLTMLLGFDTRDTLTFSYFDSTLFPFAITKRIPFELERVPTSMRFFSRYPSFAT